MNDDDPGGWVKLGILIAVALVLLAGLLQTTRMW